MQGVAIVLVVLMGLLQYKLWAGDGGIFEVQGLQRQIVAQIDENKHLKERNAALAAEVHDLKHGLSAIEERARLELGMIRKDETFYQVVNPND